MKRIKSIPSKIALIIFFSLLITAFFLFVGLTPRNIGFYLPRRTQKILALLLVSFAITYSSISFQTIAQNHLLTPSVMGLDSLYLFIQTVIVFFLGSRSITMITDMTNYFVSIGVMIVCSTVLFVLLFRKEGKSMYFLLLTGMIFGTFFGGLSSFMQVLLDPNEFLLVQGKMFASFANINTKLLWISLVIVGVIFVVLLFDFRKLDGLSLGREHAINLGINYQGLVLKNLILISILTAVSTALVGPVTFLGIIITSLVRHLIPTYKHSVRILGGTFLSYLFLILGVVIVERVLNFTTTVSVLINLVGGLYFIILILKETKK